MQNDYKYRFFQDEGVVVSKFYGVFDLNEFLNASSNIISSKENTEKINKGITDLRQARLDMSHREV